MEIGPIGVPLLEAACDPVQPSVPVPPEAVHEEALAVVQAMVVFCPATMVLGTIVRLRIVAAGAVTVSSAVAVASPPGPLQISVYE